MNGLALFSVRSPHSAQCGQARNRGDRGEGKRRNTETSVAGPVPDREDQREQQHRCQHVTVIPSEQTHRPPTPLAHARILTLAADAAAVPEAASASRHASCFDL